MGPQPSPQGFTDVHVHLAALPTPSNGCLLSPRMRKSPLVRMIAWQQGLPFDDPETANRRYVESLVAELSSSGSVSRAVLLGMDGSYDSSGDLDEGHTDFMISNDYVLKVVAEHPEFLAGVSVNPARKDAVDELERCAAKGAALVKVLPNAQVFDPAEPRYKGFYRAMARLKLPLLSHVGYEFSLVGQDQSVGEPQRLRPALEEGVLVIAAHGCTHGLFVYEKHFDTMLELVKRYENFYVDTSALTLPNRCGGLLRISRHPELFARLLMGTDYPLPCFAFPVLGRLNVGGYLRARAAGNRFDRQARVLKELGIELTADFSTLG